MAYSSRKGIDMDITIEEVVAALNGVEYPVNIEKDFPDLNRRMKEAGIVVVYGASDDNMEFEGAISDEVGCYNGGFAYLNTSGMLVNECDNDECPYFEKIKAKAAKIEAIWCEDTSKDGYSWTYKTDIPHATFDVVEEGEKYCRGIVFRLADVGAEP